MQRMGFHAEDVLACGTIKPQKGVYPWERRANDHDSFPFTALKRASDLIQCPTEYFLGYRVVSCNFVFL